MSSFGGGGALREIRVSQNFTQSVEIEGLAVSFPLFLKKVVYLYLIVDCFNSCRFHSVTCTPY